MNDDEEQASELQSLLNFLEERRMRDLELSGVGGYAGNSIRNMAPERPAPLERYAQQPEAEPGFAVRGGMNNVQIRNSNIYGGGGGLEFAFPIGDGTVGIRADGSLVRIEPSQGRAQTQVIPQGVQGYYERPTGERYSLEYTQTPRHNNQQDYAREFMLRYSRPF